MKCKIRVFVSYLLPDAKLFVLSIVSGAAIGLILNIIPFVRDIITQAMLSFLMLMVIVLGIWGFLILGIIEIVIFIVLAARYFNGIAKKTNADCFDK